MACIRFGIKEEKSYFNSLSHVDPSGRQVKSCITRTSRVWLLLSYPIGMDPAMFMLILKILYVVFVMLDFLLSENWLLLVGSIAGNYAHFYTLVFFFIFQLP